ncbi:acyl-CoA thioesterase [Streptomyces sp. 8N706]|uniref:acyl-CoA thioesterase n=1 Tax=Streptomyces sp. 8N706 TaxID=3457416 RepID=UPI003FD3436D
MTRRTDPVPESTNHDLSRFRCVTRFDVPFHAVDMLGHVNSVAYLRWAESARATYQIDVLKEEVDGPRGFVVGRIAFEYFQPLRFRDPVCVGIRISRLGGKSFDFEYAVWREGDGALAATGTSAMIAYNAVDEHSIPVPQAWRDAVEAFEAAQDA